MPKYLPKHSGGYRSRPKWSFDPPGLSAASDDTPMPRAFSRSAFISFSQAKLERTGALLEGGGQVGKFLAGLLELVTRKKRKRQKPPEIPREFTVDVK
jgi:hypothetical protein